MSFTGWMVELAMPPHPAMDWVGEQIGAIRRKLGCYQTVAAESNRMTEAIQRRKGTGYRRGRHSF